MNGIGNAVVRLLGMQATSEHASVHSIEELEMLVMQSRQGGVLDPQEEALLHQVFDQRQGFPADCAPMPRFLANKPRYCSQWGPISRPDVSRSIIGNVRPGIAPPADRVRPSVTFPRFVSS